MSWTGQRARLGALARRLTEPAHEPASDGARRREAQLLAGMLLAFIPAGLGAGVVLLAIDPPSTARAVVVLVASVVLVALYRLSRTRRAGLVGSWLVAVAAAASWASILVEPADETSGIALAFTVFAVGFGAILLPTRVVVPLGLANTAAASAYAAAELEPAVAVLAAFFVWIASGTVIAISVGRRRGLAQLERRAQQLAESREGFRRLFESSVVPMGMTEAGVLTVANKALAELLGYDSPADVVGLGIFDLVAAESRAKVRELIGAGYDGVYEAEISRRDGTRRRVEANVRPYVHEGRSVRLAALRDVTAERGVQEKLRASEERYRELFENANDAVITLDADWRITSVNRASEALLGLDRSEVLGRAATDFIPPEQHDLLREQQRRKLSGEVTATTYELDILHASGRRVPVDISTRLIYEAGRPAGIHAIMRDISGHKALEEQLRQAQRLEAVGRLARGVAHDFNNILTAIDGYNDLLLHSLDPDDARRFDALEVKRAAERAAGLTRQLLAFSRRQVLQPRVLDLGALVPDLESLLRRTIGEDVMLETEHAGSPALVKADRGQLEQVLMNLAVNARDAMPDGGRLTIKTGSVTLAGGFAETLELPPGEYVELTVRDTGVGMDEETRAQVFEPFFTTKASGEGTGLGLATAYGIVRQSGGQIRVESEPGRGTAVHVLLAAAAAGERPAPARGELDRPKSGSETMLLVEDEDMVRRLARLTLERRGYRVLEAAGGDEALRLASGFDEPIHLLLTDVVMPGMNGRVLAERLAAARPETRVLFMSGYPDDAIVRHGISEADVSFLQKPFSPDDLAEKVREVLDTA